MANVLDFLGDYKGYFHKAGWSVYTNTGVAGGALQYVGKTSNEVTLAPNMEYAEWFTNTSGVQVLYLLSPDKVDPMMQFSFMQVLDEPTLALAMNLDLDTSGSDIYSFFGSAPNALQEGEWRFVTQGVEGLICTLVIRVGVCMMNGDWASGAPGEFAGLPVSIRMLQDTTITDTKRDLGYFTIQKRTFS